MGWCGYKAMGIPTRTVWQIIFSWEEVSEDSGQGAFDPECKKMYLKSKEVGRERAFPIGGTTRKKWTGKVGSMSGDQQVV